MKKGLIPLLFYTLITSFFIRYLWQVNFSILFNLKINPYYLSISLIILMLIPLIMFYVWFTLLNLEIKRQKVSKLPLFHVYTRSWLGKYIPGKAALVGAKIIFGSQLGINKKKLTAASFLEVALLILAGLLLGLLFIFFSGNFDSLDPSFKKLIFAIIIGFCILTFSPLIEKFFDLGYRFLRKETLEEKYLPSKKALWRGLFLSLLAQALNGLSFVLCFKAIDTPIKNISTLIYFMGTSPLSGALGIFAVFAPSGIGVREGVQIALLSPIISKEQIISGVLVFRILSTLVDLLFFGAGQATEPKKKKASI